MPDDIVSRARAAEAMLELKLPRLLSELGTLATIAADAGISVSLESETIDLTELADTKRVEKVVFHATLRPRVAGRIYPKE